MNVRRFGWRSVLAVALLAMFAFGGSFECRGSTHDDKPATANP